MTGREPNSGARGQRMPRRPIVVLLAASLIIGWLGAVVGGFTVALRYENEPGPAGDPPDRWPGTSPILLDESRATLVMFAHPRCPCTRASLEELDRLATRHGADLAIHVVFFATPELGESWVRGPSWERASTIPGADLHEDEAGAIATCSGVQTSGHVLLYSPDGSLVFTGASSSREASPPHADTKA